MAEDKPLNLYWTKRIENQIEADRERLLKDTEKALAQIYRDEAEEMRLKVLDVFSKMREDAKGEEGIKVNDLYRNNRYWALLNYLNDHLESMGGAQVDLINDLLIEAYENSKEIVGNNLPQRYQALNNNSTLSTGFLNVSAIKAKDIVRQVWCLDGKEFSTRIWDNKKDILAALKKGMMDYVIQGKSPWEIAKQVRAITGNTNYNCYRIARTETCHFQIKGQVDKYKEYGFTHGKFLGSSGCCDHCHERDGKIFTLDEIEKLIPVHPNCTCSFTLVTQ